MLGDVPLERVHSYKYLSVTITDDLKWDTHINLICNKARRVIGMIYRHFYSHSSPEFLIHLYKTLILEYCSVIWDPHIIYLKNRLMDVEKFVLRVCIKHWNASYCELIYLADIMPLVVHRTRSKLLLLYIKCSTCQIMFYPMPLSLIKPIKSFAYVSNTNQYLYSAVLHMISLWNSLPFDPAQCSSFAHFNALLDIALM